MAAKKKEPQWARAHKAFVSIICVIWGVLWELPSWNTSYWPWGRRYYYDEMYTLDQCLMAPVSTGANICGYMSVVGGLSAALSVFFLVFNGLQACRRRRPGAVGPKFSSLELILCLFGLAWWVAAATTATIYSERADDVGLKEEDARKAVWSLSWVNTGLFTLLVGQQVMNYYRRKRKIRYPASPTAAGIGTGPLAPSTYSLPAPPAGPIPSSPFVVPGYPATPSSTVEMYGGYPMATEPPPPITYYR